MDFFECSALNGVGVNDAFGFLAKEIVMKLEDKKKSQ